MTDEQQPLSANPVCGGCGTPLEVFDDPAPEVMEAISAYEEFLMTIEHLTGQPAEAVQLGYCTSCHSTVLLGPEVVVEARPAGKE